MAEKRLRSNRPHRRASGIVVLSALLLAACQDATGGFGRPVDAPGVPVAVDALEGAPDGLAGKINDSVVNQAAQRRIDLVSSGDPARYHLKGYVSAQPGDSGGTALTLVWDVFDASHRRAQRVSTTVKGSAQAADPWAAVSDGQITKLTAQSMNEVAAFLAGSDAGAQPQGVAMGYDGTH
jgi:predicted small secreted protein